MSNSGWMDAVSRMTYGIYILTTFDSDGINGMIASWVSQVSYEPPMVMAAIHPNRRTHQMILESKKFALNIMAKDQKEYMKRFKDPDPKSKFSNISWKKGVTGCPIILDCVSFIECELRETFTPGNHTLFVGEIIRGGLLSDREVLCTLDYEGVYLGKA